MIDYDNNIIGKQLRYYRNKSNLSQKKLADLVGVTASYIGELERGGKTDGSSVSMKNICKIAEVLNISLDILASTNIEFPQFQTNNEIIDNIAKGLDSLSLEDLIMFNKISAIMSGKYRKM